jgi:hypothetical protein
VVIGAEALREAMKAWIALKAKIDAARARELEGQAAFADELAIMGAP